MIKEVKFSTPAPSIEKVKNQIDTPRPSLTQAVKKAAAEALQRNLDESTAKAIFMRFVEQVRADSLKESQSKQSEQSKNMREVIDKLNKEKTELSLVMGPLAEEEKLWSAVDISNIAVDVPVRQQQQTIQSSRVHENKIKVEEIVWLVDEASIKIQGIKAAMNDKKARCEDIVKRIRENESVSAEKLRQMEKYLM